LSFVKYVIIRFRAEDGGSMFLLDVCPHGVMTEKARIGKVLSLPGFKSSFLVIFQGCECEGDSLVGYCAV
jgi:hypothetical protein